MKVKTLIFLIIALLLIILSSCGGKKSVQSTPAKSVAKTACDLLNDDDVSAVIDQKVAEAGHHSDYDCKYKTTAGPVRIVILRMTEPFFNLTPEQFQTKHIQMMKEGLGEDANTYKYNSVSGVGDLAITQEALGTGHSVVLVVFKSIIRQGKKATVSLTVQLVDFEKEKASQYAKALALKALQHL